MWFSCDYDTSWPFTSPKFGLQTHSLEFALMSNQYNHELRKHLNSDSRSEVPNESDFRNSFYNAVEYLQKCTNFIITQELHGTPMNEGSKLRLELWPRRAINHWRQKEASWWLACWIKPGSPGKAPCLELPNCPLPKSYSCNNCMKYQRSRKSMSSDNREQ